MTDLHFQRLDPPPGGLFALRRRLRAERQRQRRRVVIGAAIGSLAAAVLALWLLPTQPPPARIASDHPALVQLGLAPLPSQPVEVIGGAARRVETGRADVVFYLVDGR
ncbi:MAG: hypothetical protein KC620_19080 [Myxococcales bacterium]|nr:hypothetical protein [Myxococcales bacterium]